MNKHLLWAGLAVALTGLLSSASAGDLRAGAAKVSITPPASDFPFAPNSEPPFVGVHDDVYARALVLDDGAQRAAVVMLEVTRVPDPEALVSAIAKEIGTRESSVLVAASHTHSVFTTSYRPGRSTPTHDRDVERVKQGALAAVRQAVAGLQTARIGFARGEAWINVNNGEQRGRKEADPQGPSDKSLDVVRVQSLSGAPIAVLLNYSTHAEVMFRSVTKNGGYEVTGDLPGAVSRLLEAQTAPVVLFSSGAAGDQLTLFKSLQPAGRLPAADEGAGGWALLNVMARRVATSALDVLADMKPGVAQAQIASAVGVATCPGQQLRVDAKTGAVTTQERPPVNIPLSVLRINDIVLAGVGGDVASDIGKHFKTASPFASSTMVTMAGNPVGYILTDASYEKPGHAVAGSPLKSGCAEQAIVDGLVQLIKKNP